MPETRYQTIDTYDNRGQLIATEEVPYEVSDQELEKEAAEDTVSQLSSLADAELTTDKLKQLVKALARLRS